MLNVPHAAGLGINWQIFGSNGQDKADYSRGVLERFTSRAQSNYGSDNGVYNVYVKLIVNPRLMQTFISPHFAVYYNGKYTVNSAGNILSNYSNDPILTDKIVINHYYTKSREEFEQRKIPKGMVYFEDREYIMNNFYEYDHNEIFDDGILKYRNARKKKFSLESKEDKLRRVEKFLIEKLTQYAPSAAPADFFDDKLETFLTCRAVAEKLGIKIGNLSAEEYSLAWIYTTFIRSSSMSRAEIEMFMRALPEILARPFPIICNKINNLTQNEIIPYFCEALKRKFDWHSRSEWLYTQKLLRLMK